MAYIHRMRAVWLITGVLLIIVPEVLRVYFIMPFPGSQQDMPGDTRQVELAYWLHHHIWWLRLFGLFLIAGPTVHYLRQGGWGKRIAIVLPILLCALVVYAFNFRFMADKMFLMPKEQVMRILGEEDLGSRELVLVVERHGDARAYPITIIGYHHQVLDTVGGEPLLITYCTVCRTGRVWSPIIQGELDRFRLVGMDHFNAMFEDGRTGSWWRQATGECIVGPLKGTNLEEVESRQMTLKEFAHEYPRGLVLRPDPAFATRYERLAGFEDGTIDSSLEGRDSSSWEPKSWVVGVVHHGHARAYDWNDLEVLRTITDTLAGDTITIQLAGDGASFNVQAAGPQAVAAYQEFWHSWRTFRPGTSRYVPSPAPAPGESIDVGR